MQITNYLSAVPETCTWQCHIDHHNSDLGDDFDVANGTPIRASFSGTLRNVVRAEPSPYKSLYIAYLDSDETLGLSFEHMHLSRFQTPGHYAMGQTIGWSGGIRYAVGSGQATGPHLHENAVVNGKLTPIASVFARFAGTGTVTPVHDPLTGLTMRLLPQDETLTYFLEVEGQGLYVVPNQATADAIFRYLNPTTAMTRADINTVAAFIAGAPTYKTFWQLPSSAAAIDTDALAAATAAKIVIPAAPTPPAPLTHGTITLES